MENLYFFNFIVHKMTNYDIIYSMQSNNHFIFQGG